MYSDVEKYRVLLSAKTKDELNVIARQLKIRSFRKLNRDSLIETILRAPQKNRLAELTSLSWWNRYHMHVYGVATLVGLLLTVLVLVWPKPNTSERVKGEDTNSSSPSASREDVTVEARIASESPAFSSLSIDEYFSHWYGGTDLQRDQLEQEMLMKTVIWTARIKSIQPGKDGGVTVIVETTSRKSGSAFLDFDSSQKSEFLSLKENQVIKFTGVIRRFVASPFLERCKLLQVES